MQKFLSATQISIISIVSMTWFRSAQKVFVQVPQCLVAVNVNQVPSRTIKIPARYELLKQAAADRLLLNWFSDAWGKTKNTIFDNWESAGLIKKRKPVEDIRKSAAVSERSAFLWTDKAVSKNISKEPEVSNVTSSLDERPKARNKSQRQIADDWEAIKNANSENNKNLVDNVRYSAKTTIDEASKLLKERGTL